MAEVMNSSGSMVRARLRLVLIIRIRLPRIRSGARVPMRSVTWVRRWTPAGEADEQLPRLEPVQVTEGEGLNLANLCFAQVAGDALADLHGEQAVADSEGRAQSRGGEHDEGGVEDNRLVMRGDPLVDDPFNQAGDGQVHERDRGALQRSRLSPLIRPGRPKLGSPAISLRCSALQLSIVGNIAAYTLNVSVVHPVEPGAAQELSVSLGYWGVGDLELAGRSATFGASAIWACRGGSPCLP